MYVSACHQKTAFQQKCWKQNILNLIQRQHFNSFLPERITVSLRQNLYKHKRDTIIYCTSPKTLLKLKVIKDNLSIWNLCFKGFVWSLEALQAICKKAKQNRQAVRSHLRKRHRILFRLNDILPEFHWWNEKHPASNKFRLMTAFVFERAMFMLQGSYKYFILIVDLVFWIMFSSCGFVYFIYLWFPK